MTPDPLWKQWWPQFEEVMQERLQRGHEEYGDGSFNLSPIELMGEIREELLDIVGWGFLLWVRLTELQGKAVKEDIIDERQIHLNFEENIEESDLGEDIS